MLKCEYFLTVPLTQDYDYITTASRYNYYKQKLAFFLIKITRRYGAIQLLETITRVSRYNYYKQKLVFFFIKITPRHGAIQLLETKTSVFYF